MKVRKCVILPYIKRSVFHKIIWIKHFIIDWWQSIGYCNSISISTHTLITKSKFNNIICL